MRNVTPPGEQPEHVDANDPRVAAMQDAADEIQVEMDRKLFEMICPDKKVLYGTRVSVPLKDLVSRPKPRRPFWDVPMV